MMSIESAAFGKYFPFSFSFPVVRGTDYNGNEVNFKVNLSRRPYRVDASWIIKGRSAAIRREKLLKWPNVRLNKPFIVDKP
jgi:hypothetical protein